MDSSIQSATYGRLGELLIGIDASRSHKEKRVRLKQLIPSVRTQLQLQLVLVRTSVRCPYHTMTPETQNGVC